MAKLFAITTATEKLKSENGNATTVFTVTNTTSRPLRGIAKIKTMGNTEASWLKIEGEPERDFPAGGTHQYTVTFSKPKATAAPDTAQPAESFPFRLDAISSTNPDEDFTEGQVVTVEIPEQKAEEKKRFPWWIAVVVGVLLLVIGGVVLWLVLRNTGTKVPGVVGKPFAEAENELKEKGFKVEKDESEIAPDKTIDVVFKQNPEADSEADSGSTVTLSVPATTTVPKLKGLTLSDALKELRKNGLRIGSVTGDSDAIKNGQLNEVSSSNPQADERVLKNSEVSINFPCVPTLIKPCRKITNLNDLKNLGAAPAVKEMLRQNNPVFGNGQ